MLQKVTITSENASNENCSELHVLEKTKWVHMSISPWSETTDDPFSICGVVKD